VAQASMAGVKDDQYLAQLLRELASDPGYHTGKRRFPRKVDEQDASVIAGNLQAEVDRGVAERDETARRAKVTIACSYGCNACCAHLVMIYAAEAIRIARWLNLPANAAVRDAFLSRYREWRDEAGDIPKRMSDLIAAGDQIGRAELHLEYFRRGNMCAFNGTSGECTIYPVRPVACRHAHAVETAENCKPAPTDGLPRVRGFPHVPLDEFIQRARLLDRATHHAVGGPRLRPTAMIQAVRDRLIK